MAEINQVSISNDSLLSMLDKFDVGYERRIVIGYQTWAFQNSQTVTFMTSDGPDARRAIIAKASALVHAVVRQDILSTLPEIALLLADNPGSEAQIELLKRSLGS